MCHNFRCLTSANPCGASRLGCQLRHYLSSELPWLLCNFPLKAVSAHTHFRADLYGLAFPGNLLQIWLSLHILEQLMTQHALLDKVGKV